ncbi:Kiwa anti-phage protein KwaB-like domain-containing protein [Butyrivibrio proteoclasticus]|uniref:Kiwa anti-phage protein KwaB-like domain-containing protein n=1 Tax=Butyrivibrio proteoclasticus TaxID=43305 RepID=UPI00047DBF3B|nr:Kiwa anti-phage protein KwaB-like domain-containing protein [Butyrivibrio proteoclasticus]
MSKNYLKSVFTGLDGCKAWTLQLVKMSLSKRAGTSYVCREVDISPSDRLFNLICTIKEKYGIGDVIDEYSSVDMYTGDVLNNVIYKIDGTSKLIKRELESLIEATSNPDKEIEISKFKPNALILKGYVKLDGDNVQVLLVSMQKPVTTLTNKYMWISTNKFKEIKEPVLSVRDVIDVAIIGNKVYLFNLSGEKLFNMERTYRAVAEEHINDIAASGLLSNVNKFREVASTGRNPRRFVAYNDEHFKWLEDLENRKRVAKKLGIKMKKNRIDTDDKSSTEKLIKFLCNKAMIDPCNENPVEVAAAKPWS